LKNRLGFLGLRQRLGNRRGILAFLDASVNPLPQAEKSEPVLQTLPRLSEPIKDGNIFTTAPKGTTGSDFSACGKGLVTGAGFLLSSMRVLMALITSVVYHCPEGYFAPGQIWRCV
jgi:hypothetical protein